jgi:cytochrome c peroxidase
LRGAGERLAPISFGVHHAFVGAATVPHVPTEPHADEWRGLARRSRAGAAVVLIIATVAAAMWSLARPAVTVLADTVEQPTRREALGRALFMDAALSEPRGTSCASCHDPERAFCGNHGSTIGVARGSRPGVYALRNTPTVMYADTVGYFHVDQEGDEGAPAPKGGFFLDGRADSLAEQAKGPLLEPNEMNNRDAAAVVAKVAAAPYAAEFRAEWGSDVFASVDRAFDAIARSLEAYERGAELHPFTSRYDDWLRGRIRMTASERRGLGLFMDPQRGNCFACHEARPWYPDPRASLFASGVYENLGVPRNPDLPRNADPAFHDLGLAGPRRALPFGDRSFVGMFKATTLRNVAVKPAFMHNGRFARLEDVVAFYATRDTDPARWYPGGERFDDLAPADRGSVDTSEAPLDRHPGERPRLDERDIADLVSFLRALTDRRYEPRLPPRAAEPR